MSINIDKKKETETFETLNNRVNPVMPRNRGLSYYKGRHLSNADKGFRAGFAPKWIEPVRLSERVGSGVYLTVQRPPRKHYVSCFRIVSSVEKTTEI